jgi:hypothetical protein
MVVVPGVPGVETVAWLSARVTAIVGWLLVVVASATIAATPASTAAISNSRVAARVG